VQGKTIVSSELEQGARFGIADFYAGHDTHPLRAPEDFLAWRRATAPRQALVSRALNSSVGPRSELLYGGASRPVINLASLDYLGLARNPQIIEAQREALPLWGNGAAGVPLLTGTSRLHRELEAELSDLHDRSGAMLYTSGFAAALGICLAVLRRGDVAICDERAHMSWFDGVRLSGARLVTFRHSDPAHLSDVLSDHAGSRRLVIVDALYSMDGDFAPLAAIAAVAQAHGVEIIVDEAHSVFADGPEGAGTTARLRPGAGVGLVMGTFSKALSMVGGFATASAELTDYMRYYSHPYVFSAALPPAIVAGVHCAVRVARRGEDLRVRLAENSGYMRARLQQLGFDTGCSQSWIIPVIFGDRRDLLFECVARLMEAGLYVVPVDFPAVPEDALRLRIAISAGHCREDLDESLNRFEDIVVPMLRPAGLLGRAAPHSAGEGVPP